MKENERDTGGTPAEQRSEQQQDHEKHEEQQDTDSKHTPTHCRHLSRAQLRAQDTSRTTRTRNTISSFVDDILLTSDLVKKGPGVVMSVAHRAVCGSLASCRTPRPPLPGSGHGGMSPPSWPDKVANLIALSSTCVLSVASSVHLAV